MKIAFVVPTHRGFKCLPFVKSLLDTVKLCAERGHKPTLIRLDGCSNLQFGRNALEYKFLCTDSEAAFWLDDDLSWNPEDAIRLIEAEGEFVSVAYRHKRELEAYPTILETDEQNRPIVRADGALATKLGTIGFARIMRSVYEKLISAYPEREYQIDGVNTNHDHHPQGVFDGTMMGEDYGFCRLWKNIGGEIWTIPDVDITHHGQKDGVAVDYPGNLHRYLRRIPRGPEFPGVSIEAALKVEGWMSTDELTWLAEQAVNHDYIVELGSYKGRSTLALAVNTIGVVYAVDNWYGPNDIPMSFEARKGLYDEFLSNTQAYRENGQIVPVKAQHSHENLMPRVSPDMVFIDGDHSYEAVKRDVKAWMGRVRGLLCGHDFDLDSVQSAVRELIPDVKSVPGTSIWYAEIGAQNG